MRTQFSFMSKIIGLKTGPASGVRALGLSLIFASTFGPMSFAWSLPSPNPNPGVPTGPFGTSSRLLRTMDDENKSAQKTSNAVSFNCADLRRTSLKISAHASNLANLEPTRTPSGGPYKRLEVVCKIAGAAYTSGAFCNTESFEVVQIDPRAESAGLNTAVSELRIMAQNGVCGAKLIENDSILIVRYHSNFDVDMDTLGFASDGTVSRWSRTTREGRTHNMSFPSAGPVATGSQGTRL